MHSTYVDSTYQYEREGPCGLSWYCGGAAQKLGTKGTVPVANYILLLEDEALYCLVILSHAIETFSHVGIGGLKVPSLCYSGIGTATGEAFFHSFSLQVRTVRKRKRREKRKGERERDRDRDRE